MNFKDDMPVPCVNTDFKGTIFYDLYEHLYRTANNMFYDYPDMDDTLYLLVKAVKELCIEDREDFLNRLKEEL